ncbi:MAG TPA: undecaprenyl-diphosphate phosphatase [Candidatus Deferrimicrobiaceae bacterium]|nr:undecaprenyl-diphosphate phosphatase [Candidatus Deferrimicrobiaceae bacterium]
MTLLQSIFLGILQGATEFLPVSSSGHLFLAQLLLGLREPELAFDTLLHLGTLFAVLFFLRREILDMLSSLFRAERAAPDGWGRREVLLMMLSTIPTGIIGIAFHDTVETGLTVWGVGVRYLLLTSFLLISNLRFRHKWDPDRIEAWEAIAIGILQGAAVFPGLSRSGSTITLALLLGIAPSRGVKYSFLISLPAILGAALVNLHKGVSVLPGLGPSVAGFVFSLLVGYLSLLVVERLVVRGKFIRFAPYTFLLAALCFYLNFRG